MISQHYIRGRNIIFKCKKIVFFAKICENIDFFTRIADFSWYTLHL